MSTINANAGEPFEAELDGATGLAGPLTVAIYDTPGAALSAGLSTGGPITGLAVSALAAPVLAGALTVTSGIHTQSFMTTGAPAGATSIPVTSATPNFAYPSGATIASVLYGPSSAGIVETPAGSGLFAVTLTAPAAGGIFSVVWSDGVLFARDELDVAGGELVDLDDLKDYLNIAPTDTIHDRKLLRAIRTARPLIEAITGPIVARTFDEWHDGGSSIIQVRRRPSTAPGTSPVLTLTSCSEWIGSAQHDLAVVATPGAGTQYSVMIDALGTITRRTSGGGVGVFAGGADGVHVVYIAGQAQTPPNVVDATLELIRVNYMTSQPVGRGRMTVADDQDTGPHLGFFMPRKVREMLSPNRRHPSIA